MPAPAELHKHLHCSVYMNEPSTNASCSCVPQFGFNFLSTVMNLHPSLRVFDPLCSQHLWTPTKLVSGLIRTPFAWRLHMSEFPTSVNQIHFVIQLINLHVFISGLPFWSTSKISSGFSNKLYLVRWLTHMCMEATKMELRIWMIHVQVMFDKFIEKCVVGSQRRLHDANTPRSLSNSSKSSVENTPLGVFYVGTNPKFHP